MWNVITAFTSHWFMITKGMLLHLFELTRTNLTFVLIHLQGTLVSSTETNSNPPQ